MAQALVAGCDGYLWAGHHRGLLERYTDHGCLQWSRVCALPPCAHLEGAVRLTVVLPS